VVDRLIEGWGEDEVGEGGRERVDFECKYAYSIQICERGREKGELIVESAPEGEMG
jgi:hypothetical protein